MLIKTSKIILQETKNQSLSSKPSWRLSVVEVPLRVDELVVGVLTLPQTQWLYRCCQQTSLCICTALGQVDRRWSDSCLFLKKILDLNEHFRSSVLYYKITHAKIWKWIWYGCGYAHWLGRTDFPSFHSAGLASGSHLEDWWCCCQQCPHWSMLRWGLQWVSRSGKHSQQRWSTSLHCQLASFAAGICISRTQREFRIVVCQIVWVKQSIRRRERLL